MLSVMCNHSLFRSVLLGKVWHRSCLKCAICGRQLYRGAFHLLPVLDGSPVARFECVEHRASAILFGDPKVWSKKRNEREEKRIFVRELVAWRKRFLTTNGKTIKIFKKICIFSFTTQNNAWWAPAHEHCSSDEGFKKALASIELIHNRKI